MCYASMLPVNVKQRITHGSILTRVCFWFFAIFKFFERGKSG